MLLVYPYRKQSKSLSEPRSKKEHLLTELHKTPACYVIVVVLYYFDKMAAGSPFAISVHVCRFHRRLLTKTSVCFKKNHYEVLGIDNSSTSKEIRQAFLRLSKQLHPDMNPHLSSGAFSELNEAYSVLINTASRKEYDVMLEATRLRDAGRYAGSGSGSRNWRTYEEYHHKPGYSGGDSSTHTRRGTSFEAHGTQSTSPSTPSRTQNIKVVVCLFLFAFVGGCIHFFRIRSNQRIFTDAADKESREVNQIYGKVRREAKERTVQEQLDQLKEKHQAGLQKMRIKSSK